MEIILFQYFKLLAIISAIFVVNVPNPVHAILLLIIVFASSASILLILQAEFLALVFLVVYLGAIAVLFLFVVMCLNVKFVELNISQFNYFPINTLLIIIFTVQLTYFLYSTLYIKFPISVSSYFTFIHYLDSYSNIQIIGQSLFLFYFFPFLLVGAVLLLAMVGAILLTLMHYKVNRRQIISSQIMRRFDLNLISTTEKYGGYTYEKNLYI